VADIWQNLFKTSRGVRCLHILSVLKDAIAFLLNCPDRLSVSLSARHNNKWTSQQILMNMLRENFTKSVKTLKFSFRMDEFFTWRHTGVSACP